MTDKSKSTNFVHTDHY